MFWKKKKPAHKICIGVETKRCSECHGPQRPCLVDGRPATFHRFAVAEKGLLLIDDAHISAECIEQIRKVFDKTGVAPDNCKIEKLCEVRAVVEYPDGSVGTVPAEWIEFIDYKKPEKVTFSDLARMIELDRMRKAGEPIPPMIRKEGE